MNRHPAICFALIICFALTLTLILLSHETPQTHAQEQTRLVPLVTDQTPLGLANNFGTPNFSNVNDSGDYFLLGRGRSALFYRSSSSPSPELERMFQMGDEVPGFPGSRADVVLAPALGGIGSLAFIVDFFNADGVGKQILYRRNVSGGLDQVEFSDDLAPDSGGAKFERGQAIIGVNVADDIAFSAPLVNSSTGNPAQTAVFVWHYNTSSIERLVGVGDAAPGTSGTFGTVSPVISIITKGFNDLGEVLFRANVVGGTTGQGLFVAGPLGVRKVMMVGDASPAGGTFPGLGNVFLNNSGLVAFQSGSITYVNSVSSGTSRAVGTGDLLPAAIGGHLGGGTVPRGFDDDGDIVFDCNVIASAVTNFGVFRFRPSSPIEIVAYHNQPVAAVPGATFDTFSALSIGASSVVSFRSSLAGGLGGSGMFQQDGLDDPTVLLLTGQPSGLAGGGTYSVASSGAQIFTVTLADDSVFLSSEIEGGSAYYAEFLISAGIPTTLMTTADSLPSDDRVAMRTFRLGAAGDYVGFLGQRTAGDFSIVLHNIATHESSIVATSGTAAPGTSGGRLNISTVNTINLNSSGSVVFASDVIGGPLNGNSAIFYKEVGGSLIKIVAGGEVDSATGRTFSALALNLVTPSSINESGQIVFNTLLVSGATTQRGIFVGAAGSTPSRIASINQALSDGRTVLNFPSAANSSSINSSGQVAFVVNTVGGGQGIYVGTSGGTPMKVAATGDAGPGATTFTGFAFPSFNDSGEVAFAATLSGGSGGIFIGSTSGPPTALAVHGAGTPAGGTYSITTARPDVLINNAHDIAFRSNISGGTADSGYFVRRGPAGTLHAVVLQGQTTPGATGVFATITPGANNLVGELFQLGADGDLAFQNFYNPFVGNQSFAFWHVKTDDSVEEILRRGNIAPEFGGGSAITSTQATGWNSVHRFPIWARVSGGTFIDGIFLFVPVTETNTPAGTSVPVTVVDSTTGTSPVTTTFDTVTQAGETTLTTSSGGPAIPNAFSLGDPPLFYNVETTATFTGSINVCIDFSTVSFPPGANLRLLHYDGNSWVDVTTSGPAGNVICGSVTSLSPFTVVQSLNQPPLANAGPDQTTTCTSASGASLTLNGSASSDPDFDTLSFEWRDEASHVVGTTAIVNLTASVGSHTYTLSVNDGHGGTASDSVTVTVNPKLLSALVPTNVWIGLKNSDDVGTKFDLLAEVLKDGNLVGSGELDGVSGGSSGFNNASQRSIPLTLLSSPNCCGNGTLALRVSVRIAATSSHRSGTARLWYNDAQANSRFGATIGDFANTYYLLDLLRLGTAAGPGPKKTSDVTVDRNVGGNAFKPFGTWQINLP